MNEGGQGWGLHGAQEIPLRGAAACAQGLPTTHTATAIQPSCTMQPLAAARLLLRIHCTKPALPSTPLPTQAHQ